MKTKAVVRTTLIVLTVGLITLLLFEWTYRYQLIDFYDPELRAYNDAADVDGPPDKPVMLMMGDSFTAGRHSHAAVLRAAQKKYTVINSAIVGTGILETNVVAPRRFGKYRPAIFIYQVYVGNDLLNISLPVNWKELPFVRNAYWTVSNHFWSIGFLNYRLGQVGAKWGRDRASANSQEQNKAIVTEISANPDMDGVFSPEKYSPREKTYLKGDPWLLENQILVKGNRVQDYQVFLAGMHKLLSYCEPAVCKAYVVLVPHASQVNRRYTGNFKSIGAKFTDESSLFADEYPFIAKFRNYLTDSGLGHVHVLNPIGVLRESEMHGQHVYFQNDGHLNPYGQSILGQYEYKELRLQ